MARTNQTARKSATGKAPRKQLATNVSADERCAHQTVELPSSRHELEQAANIGLPESDPDEADASHELAAATQHLEPTQDLDHTADTTRMIALTTAHDPTNLPKIGAILAKTQAILAMCGGGTSPPNKGATEDKGVTQDPLAVAFAGDVPSAAAPASSTAPPSSAAAPASSTAPPASSAAPPSSSAAAAASLPKRTFRKVKRANPGARPGTFLQVEPCRPVVAQAAGAAGATNSIESPLQPS